jgi:hypothetical protein
VKAFVRLHHWHQSVPGLAIFGLAELAIAFAFASRAIDTGSIFEYFVALVALVGALQNALKLIRKCISGPNGRRKR